MKNVIIPMNFSSSSTQVILYALALMREEECTFFVLNLPDTAVYSPTNFQHKEWVDCIHNEAYQRLQKLKRDIAKIFPAKNIKLQLLFPGKILEQQVDPVSLILASTEIMRNKDLQLPYKLFRNTDSPLLFIPKDKKFTLPKRILLTLEPHVEIKQATLNPFKKLFGNHDLVVEIHKIYSGKINPVFVARDELELKQLFEVYHPKVVTLNTDTMASELDHTMLQDNFDLHIIPLSQAYLSPRATSSPILNGIATSKIPVMILPGIQKEQPMLFNRSGRTKNKTAIGP